MRWIPRPSAFCPTLHKSPYTSFFALCCRPIYSCSCSCLSGIPRLRVDWERRMSTEVPRDSLDSVSEGLATAYFPKGEVFYNPVQCFNRDLSILVLRAFDETRKDEGKALVVKKKHNWESQNPYSAEKEAEYKEKRAEKEAVWTQFENPAPLKVLEGLSASGLRAIRYAKEVPHIDYVTANDLDKHAAEAISRNVKWNDAEPLVRVSCSDVNSHLLSNQNVYDVIDLDPYGSPAPFLASSVSCVADGGLLCITATDMAILAGNYPEVSHAKYGSIPVHGSNARIEMGLRVLLHSISQVAAQYGRSIEPLMTLSLDFYARCFVRVRTSLAQVKENILRNAYVLHSTKRDHFELLPTGRTVNDARTYTPPTIPLQKVVQNFETEWEHVWMGGPIWTGTMHSQDFLTKLERLVRDPVATKLYSEHNKQRMRGLLMTLQEEVTLADHPLYFQIPALCSVVRASCPSYQRFLSALIRLGYRVSGTHCDPAGFKTDCPTPILWDVVRCFAEDSGLQTTALPKTENEAAAAAASQEESKDSKKERRSKPKILFTKPIAATIRETIRFSQDPNVVMDDFAKGLDLSSLGRWAPDYEGEGRFLPNPEENWGPKARAKKRAHTSSPSTAEVEEPSKRPKN
eukprot:ANDGO_05639.mRNA.1 tRNA (guanine(26)-N(2))-dimethyltransferase